MLQTAQNAEGNIPLQVCQPVNMFEPEILVAFKHSLKVIVNLKV